MDYLEIRAVIKYLKIKGLSGKKAHAELVSTLADNAPSYAMVKKWYAEFARGRTSTDNAPRSGRPVGVSTPKMVNKVHKLITADRRRTILHISKKLNISYGTAQSIITDKLGMRKVASCWVPRLLTLEQMLARVAASVENLARWRQNPEDFLHRLVTVGETWVHHFDPTTKRQNLQLEENSETPPAKKLRTSPPGKVMVTVFWDSEGVIMTNFLEKGRSINKEYYSQELSRLQEELKKKRCGKLSKGILLLQDNVPAHTALHSVATAVQCGFEFLRHPQHSPDLSPSDYYLFPLLKEKLRGQKFDDDEALVDAVQSFLEDQDVEFYRSGLLKLEKRWIECIDKEGDYVEK